MTISYRKYFRTRTLLKHHIEVLAQVELVTCLSFVFNVIQEKTFS